MEHFDPSRRVQMGWSVDPGATTSALSGSVPSQIAIPGDVGGVSGQARGRERWPPDGSWGVLAVVPPGRCCARMNSSTRDAAPAGQASSAASHTPKGVGLVSFWGCPAEATYAAYRRDGRNAAVALNVESPVPATHYVIPRRNGRNTIATIASLGNMHTAQQVREYGSDQDAKSAYEVLGVIGCHRSVLRRRIRSALLVDSRSWSALSIFNDHRTFNVFRWQRDRGILHQPCF
jgi:hypothetical protein